MNMKNINDIKNINPMILSSVTHLIIPTLLFWAISHKVFIVRGIINVDYLALGILVLFFRKWFLFPYGSLFFFWIFYLQLPRPFF